MTEQQHPCLDEEAGLRLPREIMLRVEAYAERHGIPTIMAQKCLLAAGLDAEEAADHLSQE